MIKGVDASSVQGKLDIGALDAAGIKFLIHKCQQGNDGKDPWFDRNTAAAKAGGWKVGAYHFMYPLPKLDPVAQAEAFFKASPLGSDDGDLPPALDLEWPDPDAGWAKWGCSAAQVNAWAKACAERMTELYGRRPMIYTYPYFAHALRGRGPLGPDVSWMADYPLWLASYAPQPAIPAPWSTYAVWQYDGNGGERLPNGGDADFNWFDGDAEALDAFCRKSMETFSHVGPCYINPTT